MGSEAYEAMRNAKIRVERGQVSANNSSGAGHVNAQSRVFKSPEAASSKVQSGRVFKTATIKPIKEKPRFPQKRGDFLKIHLPEKKENQFTTLSASVFREQPSGVAPDFVTQLKPSAERKAPVKGCLKKTLPKGSHESTQKSTSFTRCSVKVVANVEDKSPDYHFHHTRGPICYCRKCKCKGPQDPPHHNNIIALEVLAMRLRGGVSKKENTVDVDKALLYAQFNKHRLAGEALQGPHKFFLTDLYLSAKGRTAQLMFQKNYDGEESALEMMRHKRRKGTFFKICLQEWDWLDLDELAPEIRSSEPRTELDLHWELVEDSQMQGYTLDRKSNIKRTSLERSIIKANKPEGAKLSKSSKPIIKVHKDYFSFKMNLNEEGDEEVKPVENIRVRPLVKNLWA
jgi:hypothetical protein